MKQYLAVYGGKPVLNEDVQYIWPLIDAEGEAAVTEQLYKKFCIYDKSGVIAEFEDTFAHMHDLNYGLVTNCGTAALHSAFYAAGIRPGDEVICPTYTFFATAMPLFQLGALPILADATEQGGLDPIEIERLITPKTKAVVVTHIWGNPCDMDEITSICNGNGLSLIEDCSHAHGASYRNKSVGSFGIAGAWSLQAQKIVAAGEGGILATNSQEVYDQAQLLGHFNKRAMQEISPDKPYYKYAVTGVGLKYRAHPLGIAFALTQLRKLPIWIDGKQVNSRRLRAIIDNVPGIRFLHPESDDRTAAYYALVFLVDPGVAGFTRDELVAAIQAEGFKDIDVPKATSPLHTFAAFQEPISPVISYEGSSLRGPYPNAEKIAAQSVKISVPVEVESGSRGDLFITAFETVWNKVVSVLSK